jgi:GntR family transcriptional regulator
MGPGDAGGTDARDRGPNDLPSRVGIHADTRDGLRDLVLSLAPGERLPGERALAERWHVARMTIRSAIAALAREGLVRTVRGAGTFRQSDPLSVRVSLRSYADSIQAAGMVPSTRVLERRIDPAPPAGVSAFLGQHEPALLIRRVRLGDGIPFALERAWFPARRVADLDELAAGGRLYQYLADRDLLPDAGEETVRADLPTAEEARVLDMSESRPVLRLVRKASTKGVRIEYAEATFPADRHELTFPLDNEDLVLQPPAGSA